MAWPRIFWAWCVIGAPFATLPPLYKGHMKVHIFKLRRKIWRYDWSSQLYTQHLSPQFKYMILQIFTCTQDLFGIPLAFVSTDFRYATNYILYFWGVWVTWLHIVIAMLQVIFLCIIIPLSPGREWGHQPISSKQLGLLPPLLPSMSWFRDDLVIRELKQTTTATATGTSLNKRFNEENNSCARAL